MPLRVLEPPEAVERAAAAHVNDHVTSDAPLEALRDSRREQLELAAPHRMLTLGLDGIAAKRLDAAMPSGWRYLVMEGDRALASSEVDTSGRPSLVNAGPFVESTAAAIEELESRPEVADGSFELRFLKVPALHVFAAWLADGSDLVMPLSPAPAFLEAGRLYSEQEFLEALQAPAQSLRDMPDDATG
jgi:hypothetical protein